MDASAAKAIAMLGAESIAICLLSASTHTAPQNATKLPTDRSMPAAMITNVMPTAIMPT